MRMDENKHANHLIHAKSPYLLQHAYNPVDWYPWCEEAFDKAKTEDKPVFLSIGYSTCHWCHVMAHESFENDEVAEMLNKNFISIKVDKEERPDIDSIYMSVCQAFTGSGGWPTSIFMTPDQKPFFAGTYFPLEARYQTIGFKELLLLVSDKWKRERNRLLQSADQVIHALKQKETQHVSASADLIEEAVQDFKDSFDKVYGGFGDAPKFPTPHNLLFLMNEYEKNNNQEALQMAEKTLIQMYRGGMFDHIGYGFSRYSTDRYFLVPHFEKMLYDNALLLLAYSKAYEVTKKELYKDVAEKIACYIKREMQSEDGAFFSAQDADSEGEEGKFYLFLPDEIIQVLGKEEGEAFNKFYDITPNGNFEGKSIPNLLENNIFERLDTKGDITLVADPFVKLLPKLRTYRQQRYQLHKDDKILTSWNSLMISALCKLYRVSCNNEYLTAAIQSFHFIEDKLCEGDILYVSYRDGVCGEKGFLDDYANYIWALLSLYDATYDDTYLNRAQTLLNKCIDDYFDEEDGGFFFTGKDNANLIIRPKETYDGAIPSGNSVMTYNLVRMYSMFGDSKWESVLDKQIPYMCGQANRYPSGYAFFMWALSDYYNPPQMIKVVVKNPEDIKDLACRVSTDTMVRVFDGPTKEYGLLNGETTYYICKGNSCLPPVNHLD